MAWRALIAQPIGVTSDGQFSIVAQYYDDADPANAGAGLGPSGSGTASASTDLITITGHGLVAGDQIVISALTGGAGLAVGIPYRVIATGLTANTFSVAAGAGTAALDITSNATALTAAKLKLPVNFWPDAFNMALSSSSQNLIDEATKRGKIAQGYAQSRDSARASVLVGSSTVIV